MKARSGPDKSTNSLGMIRVEDPAHDPIRRGSRPCEGSHAPTDDNKPVPAEDILPARQVAVRDQMLGKISPDPIQGWLDLKTNITPGNCRLS